jgi:xanthine/uracil permease
LTGFFATLPISIGDAVLFVAYLQLFGSALKNIEGLDFNYKTIFRIALPTLTGISILSVPADVFSSLPEFTQAVVGNGMLIGIIMAVILEKIVKWDRLLE